MTLVLNAFPGIARGPDETYDLCRALSDGETLWIFIAAGSEARLATSVTITNIEQTHPEPGARWLVTDVDGFEWEIQAGGGCGCGNPLKRYSPQSLLGLIGVTV